MKYLTYILILLLMAVSYAISVDAPLGEISDMGSVILSPYSMVKGTIQFKIGNITWYPQEIWLVPLNSTPDLFRSTGASNEINSTELGKCTTNVYYNVSVGYAYKITASNIIKGSFCSVVAPGIYEVVIK